MQRRTKTNDQEEASLRRQLAEAEENLRLLKERESEYVEHTAVPLDLIKQKRRLREKIDDLKTQLRQSAPPGVRENESLLIASYLREATSAGLDMTQLPEENLGAMLECIVRQVVERDCHRLECEHGRPFPPRVICRHLAYLGWYMFNESVASCDVARAVEILEENPAGVQLEVPGLELFLDSVVNTYWLRKNHWGELEFRDSYIVNAFAALELKEWFSAEVRPSALLGLGVTSDPPKWQRAIVLLAGILTQGQAAELVEVLLDAGLVRLAGQCVADGQPLPHPITVRLVRALLVQSGGERAQ